MLRVAPALSDISTTYMGDHAVISLLRDLPTKSEDVDDHGNKDGKRITVDLVIVSYQAEEIDGKTGRGRA